MGGEGARGGEPELETRLEEAPIEAPLDADESDDLDDLDDLDAEDWPELVPEPAPPPPARRGPSDLIAGLVPARLRSAAHEARLRLDDLPLGVRRLAVGAVIATLLAVAFLGPDLLLGWWPAPVIRIPGTLLAETLPGRLSIPAFVLALFALGAGAAAMAGSAASRPGRSRRAIQVLLGLAGLEVGAALYGTAAIADLVVTPQLASVPRVAGGVAMAAGVALAVSPGPLSRLLPWGAGLATVPFAAAALTTLQLAAERATVQLGVVDDSWPRTIEGAALAAGSLSPILVVAGGLLGVLFLWQSVVAARAVRRRIATASGGLAAGRPRVLAALLGAKAAWLIAGYAGLLPALLAGGNDAWARARGDDPAGIVVAVALAAVAGAWLLRGARPRVPDSGVPAAAAIFAVGFNAPFVLAGLLLGLVPVADLAGALPAVPPAGIDLRTCLAVLGATPAGVTECLSAAARDLIPYAGFATWAASAVAVPLLLLTRRPRARALAVALGAIVLWAAPSAIFVAQGLLGVAVDSVAGRPELLNVDAALTMVVGVLAVLWWMGRQRAASPRSLMLVLVVSTLVAQAGVIVPEAARPLVFGLLVVMPPLYQLVFESERVNESGESRPELVLRTLGLQLLGLGFLVTAIAFDQLQTGAADLADLLVPPVVGVLVAAEVARRERPRRLPERPRPDVVPAARWAAVGALAVAGVAAILTPFAMPAPGPSDAARYAAFVTRVDQERGLGVRALDNLLTIVSTDPNGIEAAFVEFAAQADGAKAWVDANPPAACYAAEQRGWEAVVAAMVVARDSILSGADLEANLAAYVQAAADFSPGLAPCRTEGRTGG